MDGSVPGVRGEGERRGGEEEEGRRRGREEGGGERERRGEGKEGRRRGGKEERRGGGEEGRRRGGEEKEGVTCVFTHVCVCYLLFVPCISTSVSSDCEVETGVRNASSRG